MSGTVTKSRAIMATIARQVHGITLRFTHDDRALAYRKGRQIGFMWLAVDSGTGELWPVSYRGPDLGLLRDDIIESMLQLGLATPA
jgi:hypothetical protein